MREEKDPRQHKPAVRSDLLSVRGALSPGVRHAADVRLLAALVTAVLTAGAGAVAAYLPFGSEPGATATPALPDALRGAGLRVLLPVLLPDLDLDWAEYDGSLAPGRYGLREPTGPRLGPAALAGADLVIAPAVAVDSEGVRLGRGGGSYDRALARVPAGVPVVVPLYDDELVDRLPAEPHDVRVSAVVTPSRGLVRLPLRA
ncbi:MAG: 5-formyltetrahydrofolate cyclo-ligase [Micromonosporaceae bacterium]